MSRCRITVLKKMVNQDLVDKYGRDVETPCNRFEEGQEFIMTGGEKPDGFCTWAWVDISRDAMIVQCGGNLPWINEPGTHIVCCTDGLRPVVFKVERLD